MIRILGSLHLFIKESLDDEVGKSTGTPSKSIPVKKSLLDMPERKCPIYKLVFSTVRKTTRKSLQKTSIFGQEKETSKKESHDNLDQLLTMDNLHKSGLHIKVVLATSSGNVLMETPRNERTDCFARNGSLLIYRNDQFR